MTVIAERSGAELVADTYGQLGQLLRGISESDSWTATGCTGWTVRDLTYHCLLDARRALVAMHTPSDRLPDRDSVTYWADWGFDEAGAANGRRFARVVASMFRRWDQLRAKYLETTVAAIDAAHVSPAELHSDAGIRSGGGGHVEHVEATIRHVEAVA